jgi:hypothetical protein
MARVLALVWLALVAGCMTQPVPTDPRVFLTPDAGVLADPPTVVAAPMMRVSVRLVNPEFAAHRHTRFLPTRSITWRWRTPDQSC